MNERDFKDFVTSLKDYYRLEKVVSNEGFMQWYEKVSFIPSEALPYIANMIEQEWKDLPRNLPMVMKSHYFGWKAQNQDKFIKAQQTPCDECGGRGIIFSAKRTETIMYSFAHCCKKCDNWKRHVGRETLPFSTKAELRENGFEIIYELPVMKNTTKKIAAYNLNGFEVGAQAVQGSTM